jgi:ATP-binding cassette subfamily F protein 3
VAEKERRFLEKMKQFEKEQAKIAQLENAAEKLHLWAFMGSDKLHKRAFSMEKRMERMRTTDKPKKERSMAARFGEREFCGDEVLVTHGLKKSFESRTLFEHVELEVEGGERIALLGDNGTGKSTFLKIVMGEEFQDGGTLRLGPTVKIGYLPQIVRFSHPERNLVDTMLYECNCTTQQARDRLAAFHFYGEEVFKTVSALSGGEQSRLRLCMLMDERINLLILDEPTNHLDISSREWIEDAVEEYAGNLLFVSHDRYFINRFAQRIWTIQDGAVQDFKGTFEEYRAKQERQVTVAPPKEEKPKQEKPKRTGGTKLLEKQVTAAERAVAKTEEQLFDLGGEIETAASDYLKLQELYEKRDQLEDELAHLYAEWERLSEELEEAGG